MTDNFLLHDRFSYFMPGTNGMGVVLVHGLTGAPSEMKWVAKYLNRKGYAIYAPLLAGHGVDEKTLIQTHWQNWTDSVSHAAAALCREVDSVFAAGICVGGHLSFMAAHQHPGSIQAVSILSPTFHYDGWGMPFFYPILSHMVPVLELLPIWKNINFPETENIGVKSEKMRKLMSNLSAEGVLDCFPALGLREMYHLSQAMKKAMAQTAIPTLILHAREDDLAHPRNAELMNKIHQGPHELHWIDDSYHMIHLDQYQRVVELCDQYFQRYCTGVAEPAVA